MEACSVRVGRIELPSHPWQGRVLPLNHTRILLEIIAKYSYLQRICAPGGIRTPTIGSEDRCDIHFTTGAKHTNYGVFTIIRIIGKKSKFILQFAHARG